MSDFPFVEEGEDVGYAFNTSADDARELAEAITTAADECGASEGSDPPRFERLPWSSPIGRAAGI